MSVARATYVEALKEAYRILRTRYRSEPFSFRVSDEPRWISLADNLIRQGGDPFSYVKYVFEKYLAVTGDIYPNQILSPAMVTEYMKFRPELIKRLELLLQLQADNLKTKLKNGWKLEEALQDTDLSPIFCFVAALSKGESSLADKFRSDAERAILFEPEYKRILGAWLPTEMK